MKQLNFLQEIANNLRILAKDRFGAIYKEEALAPEMIDEAISKTMVDFAAIIKEDLSKLGEYPLEAFLTWASKRVEIKSLDDLFKLIFGSEFPNYVKWYFTENGSLLIDVDYPVGIKIINLKGGSKQ